MSPSTVVYHNGAMWCGPDAIERAFNDDEPDEILTIDEPADAPPRMVTVLRAGCLLEEFVALMDHWSRRYPAAVVKPAARGWEVWTKPTPAPPRLPRARWRRRFQYQKIRARRRALRTRTGR